MAEPFKRDGSWVVPYRDWQGGWHQLRTSAKTKEQARRVRDDLERKAERQRLGLEPLPSDLPVTTFDELADLWWKHYGARLRSRHVRSLVDLHLRPTLGPLPLTAVPGQLEALFAEKDGADLSPRTVNYLRAMVHRLFVIATKRGLWTGPNPAKAVERRKQPKGLPQYLRPHEVMPFLSAIEQPRHRRFFATFVYTGMRPCELHALEKSSVDLDAGTIAVLRSEGATTTKGKHADVIPIADELRPYLVEALKASPSELVFPRTSGKVQTDNSSLRRLFHRALGRAGIVSGYMHKCRGKGCGFEEKKPDTNCGLCPRCCKHLWAKPVPRPLRMYDLRHTTATLLLKAGVPFATVQRLLRHSDPRITTEVYGHLDVEDMRQAVNKLNFGPKDVEAAELPSELARVVAGGLVPGQDCAPVVRGTASTSHATGDASPKALLRREDNWSGRLDLNQRPLDPQSSALTRLRYAPTRRLLYASEGGWVNQKSPRGVDLEAECV
jgi:integrase